MKKKEHKEKPDGRVTNLIKGNILCFKTYTYLCKQWDKMQMTSIVYIQRNNCACPIDRVEHKTHITYCVLCVGVDQYRITIVHWCSISPTAAKCDTWDRAIRTSGWDSHCFHCQIPKAKGCKPLKGRTGHVQTLHTN